MGKLATQTLSSEMIELTEQVIEDGLYFETRINQINPFGITPLYDEEMGL